MANFDNAVSNCASCGAKRPSNFQTNGKLPSPEEVKASSLPKAASANATSRTNPDSERSVSGLPIDLKINYVSWSPDGAHLAFTVRADEKEEGALTGLELWVANVGTAQARKLIGPPDKIVNPIFDTEPSGLAAAVAKLHTSQSNMTQTSNNATQGPEKKATLQHSSTASVGGSYFASQPLISFDDEDDFDPRGAGAGPQESDPFGASASAQAPAARMAPVKTTSGVEDLVADFGFEPSFVSEPAPESKPSAQANRFQTEDLFGASGQSPHGPPANQNFSIPSKPQQKSFQTKSTIWNDLTSSGLVDLNISGPKTNPLAELEWPGLI